ncbi:MAG: alpha/beta hydrolase [Gammaproteobacteria bacterium]
MNKQSTEFTNDGLTLRGWFARPDNDERTPVIVLVHGLSGIAALDLADYAKAFVASGYACFAYDHRNWGDSDGKPRSETDPWKQVADMRAAISFVRAQDWVDPDRVGIWGTSYGGGHVLTVAALDHRVACAVSQVPLISGWKTFELWVPEQKQEKFLAGLAAEQDARYRGEPPQTVPAAQEGSDTAKWIAAKDTEGRYVNALTLLSFDLLRCYEPGDFAAKIMKTPTLMIVADNDKQTPTAWQREAFERITATKRLVEIPGGHYDVYTHKLDAAASAARDWFKLHL